MLHCGIVEVRTGYNSKSMNEISYGFSIFFCILVLAIGILLIIYAEQYIKTVTEITKKYGWLIYDPTSTPVRLKWNTIFARILGVIISLLAFTFLVILILFA